MNGRVEHDVRLIKIIDDTLQGKPEYLKEFNLYMGTNNKTAKTRLNYISELVKFSKYLEENNPGIHNAEDFEGITIKDLRAYLQKDNERVIAERGNMSDAYAAKRHYALKNFFTFLENDGYVSRNLMQKIDAPKNKTRKEKTFLSIDEVREMKHNISSRNAKRSNGYFSQWEERDMAIVEISLVTALRVSAIVAINMEDIDFQRKTISVVEKGNKKREVYLDDAAINAIQNWLPKRKEYMKRNCINTPALFLSRKHKRISAQTIGYILNAYTDGVGKHLTPHVMRRTTCNNIIEKTGNIELARQVLGHASISTTQLYKEALKGEKLQETAKMIGGLYEEKESNKE